MSDDQQVRITIHPKPNDREAAAIAAAVVAITSKVPEDEASRPVNKWKEAGKREALRDQMWERHP